MKTITDKFDAIIANQDFKKQSWIEIVTPYLQAAFSLVALFAANDLLVTIWRSMTGH
jgi:hypothetical protein